MLREIIDSYNEMSKHNNHSEDYVATIRLMEKKRLQVARQEHDDAAEKFLPSHLQNYFWQPCVFFSGFCFAIGQGGMSARSIFHRDSCLTSDTRSANAPAGARLLLLLLLRRESRTVLAASMEVRRGGKRMLTLFRVPQHHSSFNYSYVG